jgi:hypothetical protein
MRRRRRRPALRYAKVTHFLRGLVSKMPESVPMCGGQIVDVMSAGLRCERMPQLSALQHHCPPSSSIIHSWFLVGSVAGEM